MPTSYSQRAYQAAVRKKELIPEESLGRNLQKVASDTNYHWTTLQDQLQRRIQQAYGEKVPVELADIVISLCRTAHNLYLLAGVLGTELDQALETYMAKRELSVAQQPLPGQQAPTAQEILDHAPTAHDLRRY